MQVLLLLFALPVMANAADKGPVAIILENVENYRNTQNYRAAINRGLEGLPIVSEKGSPAELTLLYGDIGSSYLDLGIVDSALKALQEAESLAQQHDFKKALPIILNEQTEAYFYLPDLQKAQQTAKRAIKYGRDVEDWGEVSRSLIALGNIHFRQRNLDSALAYYRQDVAISDKHSGSTATTLMNMGIIWDTRGAVDSALYYYLRALDQSRMDSSQAEEASVLQNLGTFYDDRGNHAEALSYYQQALHIFNDLNDQQSIIITSYNIASVLINQDQLTEGIKALNEVEVMAQKLNYHDIQNYCHLALTGAYYRQKKYDSMYAELQELSAHLQKYPDKFIETEFLLHMSQYYSTQEQINQAIEYAMQARVLAEETEQTSTFLEASRLLSEYHLEQGNNRRAMQYAFETYDMAILSGFINEAYQGSLILSQLYEKQLNYQQAFTYLQKAVAFKDSLSAERAKSETNRLLLQRLKNEYQELEYQKSIDESELVAQEAMLEKQRWRMGLIIALVILFAILLGTVYYNRSRLKKINKQLLSKNQKIEEQNVNLAQLNQDKDRLMHVVAHDLRNPVNGIKGLAQLLEADPNLTEDQKQSVSHMLRSSNHTLGIINELVALDIDNPREVEVTEVDVHALVQDIIQSHVPHANTKNITIKYENGNSVRAYTDADKVQRIIDNLVSNAIKFTEPNKAVAIRLKESDDHFSVDITDQGPGLTEEDKKSLFAKFKKLSAKPTAGESSTGLGLSIVHDFVKLLDGEIKVDSTVGEGTTFTLILSKHLNGQNA